jgi:4-amino-4-deoxy-L-arabinose transferase-like glycosyltransferase
MRTSRSWSPSSLVAAISRLEIAVGAVAVAVLGALALVEPDVLAAPFENGRTIAFTLGGTALAAAALVVMLRAGVRPVVRVLALGVPFVAVTWWLVSPFFVDQHVDEEFAVSIADASSSTTSPSASSATTPDAQVMADATPTTTPPTGPTLRGSGSFVGLAGHSGSGTAGVFELVDGTSVLRLEGIDIQNGPDLHLYVVPGTGATDPVEGSVYLGELRGNVGDLTYDLAPDAPLAPGPWTVLVWCDAFDVEFVGADVILA